MINKCKHPDFSEQDLVCSTVMLSIIGIIRIQKISVSDALLYEKPSKH